MKIYKSEMGYLVSNKEKTFVCECNQLIDMNQGQAEKNARLVYNALKDNPEVGLDGWTLNDLKRMRNRVEFIGEFEIVDLLNHLIILKEPHD